MAIEPRCIKNLAQLGLSNNAIVQELKLLNHELTPKISEQLDSFKKSQNLNEFADLMHIRCIIYYGRIKIPRWTTIQILNYIRINKHPELDNEKYTTDYLNTQLSKWDQLNATISLTEFRSTEYDGSNIKDILALGYGMNEVRYLFGITLKPKVLIEKLSTDGIEISTYLPNHKNDFFFLRRYMFYLKKMGSNAKRIRDLLCEYGYNFLTYTDDIIEPHFQWNTERPHDDKEEDFIIWKREKMQHLSPFNQINSREITETNQLIHSTSLLPELEVNLQGSNPSVTNESNILEDHFQQGPNIETYLWDKDFFSKRVSELDESDNQRQNTEMDENEITIDNLEKYPVIEEHSSDDGSEAENMEETSDKLENKNTIIEEHLSDDGSEDEDVDETDDELEDLPLSKAFLNDLLKNN